MAYLLDTSICVFFLRGKVDLDKMMKEKGRQNCYISEITVFEIRFGAENSNDIEKSHKAVDSFSAFAGVLHQQKIKSHSQFHLFIAGANRLFILNKFEIKNTMQTIQVKISDSDFQRYQFNNSEIKFTDLVDKISLEFARQSLLECNAIAEKVGLSNMTLEEIDAEIKAVRDAKANS